MRRTQIYLTDEQIRELKRAAQRRRVSMATLIREAVDRFLKRRGGGDAEEALDRTLGALPDLEVPSRSEWDRGYA
ncbi:MAG: CopG family transcriptional regulator [Actinomycetota bacterium]